jgi:hypothetical protein
MSQGFDTVALIVGLISAGVSITSIYITNKKNAELEELKSRLETERDEKASRRDYEYEARKNLYHEIDPLVFLFIEACDSALSRIYNITMTAHSGNLGVKYNALSHKGYYLKSTVYRLLVPFAILKLMQNKLTLVDLDLVPYSKALYSLAKYAYFTFIDYDDFKHSNYNDQLNEDRENVEKGQYHNHKIYRGLLDNAIEALLTQTPNNPEKIMSFGEFEKKYSDNDISKPFEAISCLFLNFHPKTKPFLWMILIAQAHIYQSIDNWARSESRHLQNKLPIIKMMSLEHRKKYFDWRYHHNESTDEEVFNKPFDAVESYFDKKIKDRIQGKKLFSE